ncbi:MAG: exonuclease domain-containing protein [Xanthomonadales bacterium]|nr:exonuclease domain-containing protein [Xanthomonadales bacterium]
MWPRRDRFQIAARAREALADRLGAGPAAEALRVSLPAPDTPLRRVPLLAVDLEMTGLDPDQHHVLSAGWVPIDAGRLRLAGSDHRLVRDAGPVGASATVHGIVDSECARGDPVGEVLEALITALAGRILLMHHAPLDLAFLGRMFEAEFGRGLREAAIDTLRLEERRRARRQLPAAAGSLRLPALRRTYGLPPMSNHNALSDAIATGELLLAMTAGENPSLADLA